MQEINQKATAEQIATWKAKYQNVFEIYMTREETEPENEALEETGSENEAAEKIAAEEAKYVYGYFHKPSRAVISHVARHTDDIVKSSEIMFNGCVIAAYPEVKTDNDLFFAFAGKVMSLMKVREAEIKKL